MVGSLEVIQLNLGRNLLVFMEVFPSLYALSYKGPEMVDSKAFIFTLTNPHNVPPTRYMRKNKKLHNTIAYPGPNYCPILGKGYDIHISDRCNQPYSCDINNNGSYEYECDPIYKGSLFTHNSQKDKYSFSVTDYEVFAMKDMEQYIKANCECPEVMSYYMERNDIKKALFKTVNDEMKLFRDLEVICNYDDRIRMKISENCAKPPSQFLAKSHLVNNQYDRILKEWLGKGNMQLLYRASEHNFTAESFHKYCDDKGPTLILIKSNKGWIFGGYTTQSWTVDIVNPGRNCIIYF